MSICDCRHDLLTGFDDVPFRIMRGGQAGEYRDWIIKPVVQITHIPGTNRTYTEHLGYEPARATWTLRFCCVEGFNALLARYMTVGTLTVLHGYQSLRGSAEPQHILGRDYEMLDNVFLLDIGDTPHFVGGAVEAEATFQRAVDPVTRLAVIA